mgnify:CR=1 FL=1|jgi:CubicO group peptidase (beta-lactamase class C family)
MAGTAHSFGGAILMSELSAHELRDLGFRADELAAAGRVVADECEKGSFPGAVCLVARGGRVALLQACGALSPTRTGQVTAETIYDLASVTKPMTTAVAAMRLAARGELSFLQQAVEFFPERKLPHLEGVTLKQLATHTSGLPAWVDLYTGTAGREEAIEQLLSIPLKHAPGRVFEYSCMGYILLGLICERVCGESLQDFLDREVWGPLGMGDTGYLPPEARRDRIASTLNCPARAYELVGEVHDGNAWRLGGISGNAGLFSTASDILKFCRAVMAPDAERPLFSRMELQRVRASQIAPEIGAQSYGWFCTGSDMLPAGDFLPSDAFGHTGFTGTSVVMVPSEDLAIILLTNRVCTDPGGAAIRRTRRRFHNAVAHSVV